MTDSPADSSRWSQKLLGAGCFALPLLIGIGVILVIIAGLRTVERSNQMYAKWHVGELLVDYLRAHDNQWPDSWEQLEDHFPEKARGGYPYGEIRTMLQIDFTVSEDFICDRLENIRSGKIKIVWSRSGDESHYEGADPNEIIADYYEHVCSQKDSREKP